MLGFFGFDMRGADWIAWSCVVTMLLFLAVAVPGIAIRMVLDIREYRRDRKSGLY